MDLTHVCDRVDLCSCTLVMKRVQIACAGRQNFHPMCAEDDINLLHANDGDDLLYVCDGIVARKIA